jgi:hypothetical protein
VGGRGQQVCSHASLLNLQCGPLRCAKCDASGSTCTTCTNSFGPDTSGICRRASYAAILHSQATTLNHSCLLPVCLCVGCRWLPLVALDPSPHLAAVLQCSDSLCQSCAWPSSCKKCYKYGLLAGRPFFPIYKEAGSGLCKLVGGAGAHHGPWSLSPLPSNVKRWAGGRCFMTLLSPAHL